MRTGSSVLAVLLACGMTTAAVAEDYDYQVSLGYASAQSDSTVVPAFGGVPDPSLGISTSSSDSDTIELTGAWFYSGLSDDNGPKSRAAFMSRASSLIISYAYGDESTTTEFSGGGIIPPQSLRGDGSSNEYALDLRHVWPDSGWFARAGISRAESDVELTNNGGVPASATFNANRYTLGVGKYLGQATTLELGITTLDVGSSNPTVVALSVSHIGSLGTNWQYGADVAFAKSDTGDDGDAVALRGSLFPTLSVEFGLSFSRQDRSGGLELESTEVFAGWFVRDNVELSARFRLDDPDTFPGQDIDSDEFGIGVSMRF